MAREKQEREDERGAREGSRGKSREGKLRQSCGEGEKGNVNVERRKKSCGLRFNVQYQYELKYI